MGWGFLKKITGVEAYQCRKKAKTTKEEADNLVSYTKWKSESLRQEASEKIESFGRYKCQSLKNTVGNFIRMINYMDQHVKDKEYSVYSSLTVSKEEVAQLESIEMNASKALQTAGVAGGLASVALAGVPTAVTSAVGMLATASTGTAISSLSGAAATNATLAWLGGGSIAAGGGGMAAGAAVLSGITYASAGVFALAATGIVASSYYSKKYTEAVEYLESVKVWSAKIDTACEGMRGIIKRCEELNSITQELEKRIKVQLGLLEPLVYDFDKSDDYQVKAFQNAAILIKSMSNLAQTPLISEEGEVSRESSIALSNVKTILNKDL